MKHKKLLFIKHLKSKIMKKVFFLLFALLSVSMSFAQVTGVYDTQRSNLVFEKNGVSQLPLPDT